MADSVLSIVGLGATAQVVGPDAGRVIAHQVPDDGCVDVAAGHDEGDPGDAGGVGLAVELDAEGSVARVTRAPVQCQQPCSPCGVGSVYCQNRSVSSGVIS